jgi:Mce-associated membrane protein
MPSRERPIRALDTDRCDDPPPQAGDTPTLAEAMEEVARAEARAEAARSRAIRLSRDAEATSSGHVDTGAATDANNTGSPAVEESVVEAEPVSARWTGLRRRSLRRPGPKAVAVGAAVVLICASLGISGYVVWYHRQTVDERRRAADFAAAARQGAIALMSMDATKARDGVQRIIDDTTGTFKAGILITEDELVKAAEESKVSTKVSVQAVAVESMTADSAVVLLVTKAEVANPDKTTPPPRSSRIVMNLQRDGGQLKVSGVEFLR